MNVQSKSVFWNFVLIIEIWNTLDSSYSATPLIGTVSEYRRKQCLLVETWLHSRYLSDLVLPSSKILSKTNDIPSNKTVFIGRTSITFQVFEWPSSLPLLDPLQN